MKWIKALIDEWAQAGAAVMPEVTEQLLTVGNSQMDVYTGNLSLSAIADNILEHLLGQHVLDPVRYADWLHQSAGYRLVTLPDESQWVLRWGEAEGRYIHIHPARYSPDSIRVKASILKTGILVSLGSRAQVSTAAPLAQINRLRKDYLLLPPIRSMEEAEGLRRVLEWLH